MDWERTKTVFILAFLLLNAIFMVQLWLIPSFFDPSAYISSQQVEAKLAELGYSNISVSAEVPRRLQRMQILKVRSLELIPQDVAAALLGDGYALNTDSGGVGRGFQRFTSAEGQAMVYNDGRIKYTSAVDQANKEISRHTAQKKAEEFLKRTLGMPRDARPGRALATKNGRWVVEYVQHWRGKDLRISRIVLIVDEKGVQHMEYYWVDVLGLTGEDIITIPSTGALTVAAEAMPSGSVITSIYLSWYSSPTITEEWRAYPVWVIETAAGVNYFINAFTGDLEGREELPAGKPGTMTN